MKCALEKIKHTDNIEMCTQIILDKIKHTDNIEMCIRQNKAHR